MLLILSSPQGNCLSSFGNDLREAGESGAGAGHGLMKRFEMITLQTASCGITIRESRPMFKQLTLAAVLAALPAVAAASDSPGDTPAGRQRVTIRGTGSSVEIERTEASARKQPRPAAEPAGVLDQAADLKARGASDAAVVDYLHAHQASLPPIIEARDIRTLRKAGAGQSVVTWLTTVAAVDIGETGEGHEAAASAALPSAESEGFPYGQPYAWGVDGGYGMPYYFSSGYGHASPRHRPSHHMRGVGRSGRGVHIPARPAFSGASPSRAMHSQLPLMR